MIVSAVVTLAANFFIGAYVLLTTKNQFSLFAILFGYSVVFILLYTLSKEFKAFVNRNTSLITIISILIPLSIFSFQISSEIFYNTFVAEDSIKDSNHLNYRFIEGIEKEIKDQAPLFKMNNLNYLKYYDYISKNYSFDCKNRYAGLIVDIDQFNEVTHLRNELMIVRLQLNSESQIKDYNDLYKGHANLQFENLPHMKENLAFLMNNCQDFKQRK